MIHVARLSVVLVILSVLSIRESFGQSTLPQGTMAYLAEFGDFSNGNGGNVSIYDDHFNFVKSFASVNAAHNVYIDAVGNVYVSSHFAGLVYRYNHDGTGETVFCGPGTFRGAAGMAFDNLGRFYVADYGNGNIYRYNHDGSGQSLFLSGINGPNDLEFRNGDLFVAQTTGGPGGSGSVLRFDTNGVLKSSWFTGMSGSVGFAFDSNHVYVSGFNTGEVRRYNLDGSANTQIVSGLNHIHGITAGPDNRIYFAEEEGNRLWSVKGDGSDLKVVLSGVNHPINVAYSVTPELPSLFQLIPGLLPIGILLKKRKRNVQH